MKAKHTVEILEADRKAGKRRWYWHVVHSNGNIKCTSQTYANRADAEESVRNMFEDAQNIAGIPPAPEAIVDRAFARVEPEEN